MLTRVCGSLICKLSFCLVLFGVCGVAPAQAIELWTMLVVEAVVLGPWTSRIWGHWPLHWLISDTQPCKQSNYDSRLKSRFQSNFSTLLCFFSKSLDAIWSYKLLLLSIRSEEVWGYFIDDQWSDCPINQTQHTLQYIWKKGHHHTHMRMAEIMIKRTLYVRTWLL